MSINRQCNWMSCNWGYWCEVFTFKMNQKWQQLINSETCISAGNNAKLLHNSRIIVSGELNVLLIVVRDDEI